MQFLANQFGFDRDGFRVFVLCAAPRRDILLGKNLAFAPLVLGMAAIFLVITQVVSPLRLDHLAAIIPQFASMYLVFCLLMNLLSIYTPMHVAQGTMKPSNQKLIPVLAQLTTIGIFFPLTQIPMMLPLGIEAGLTYLGWNAGLPICLALTLVEFAVVVVIYRYVLVWQGRLLHSREQAILEVVTNHAP
jgi:ABC-2 type transport system permease protein